MTLTLTPTPERQARLEEQAQTPNLPLRGYALHVLDGDADAPRPRLGADLIAQWEREGVFLPEDDLPDSPALARQIRADAWGRP